MLLEDLLEEMYTHLLHVHATIHGHEKGQGGIEVSFLESKLFLPKLENPVS